MLKKEDHGRLTEAVTQALQLGEGVMSVFEMGAEEETLFSQHAYAKESGESYSSLEPHDFSFNHPSGMCTACEGLGHVQDFDLDLIIDPELSIAEGCCMVAGSYETVKWGNIYNNLADLYGFSVDTPWKKLSASAQKVFLYGNKKKWTRMRFVHPKKKSVWTEYIKWRGVLEEAKNRFNAASSDLYRNNMLKLMHEMICPDCQGSKLKPYPSHVTVGKKAIHALTSMTIKEAATFFEKLTLPPFEAHIATITVHILQVSADCTAADRVPGPV